MKFVGTEKLKDILVNFRGNLLNNFKEPIPMVTIVDDDGKTEFDTRLKAVYDAKGVKVTLGIITDKVGTSGYLTLDQLLQYKSEGYEIVSHTKTHNETIFLTNIASEPDSSYVEEFSASKSWLRDNGFGECDILVYPYANFSSNAVKIKNIARKYYKHAFNADGWYNTSPIDPMYINRYFIDITLVTLDQIKAMVDTIVANKGWLVLGVHSWDTVQNTPELMGQIIDYIQSKNVQILTASQALNYKDNIISVGEFTNPNTGFFVGKDGNVLNRADSVKMVSNVQLDDPLTNYTQEKLSICEIDSAKDNYTNTGGILYVYNGGIYFGYQIYLSNDGTKMSIRAWNGTSWNPWNDVIYKSSEVIQSVDTGIMDKPPTNYAKYRESIVQIKQEYDTFKSMGGILKIYNADTGYSFETFIPINENSIYKRVWDSANSIWGTWAQIV